MNLRKALIILAILPPLVFSCGGKDPINELPPPTPIDNGGGEQGGQGKEVTPLGEGWTAKEVEDGIVYYSFSGVDEISKLKQEVFAVDVDLNNPKFQVKLVYTSPRTKTSEAFKRFGAVAAMNANYEPASIYIRVGGEEKSKLPNVTIGDTDVPNWKSEAAFACGGTGGVQIFFAGSSKRDGKITGIKGHTVAEAVGMQRTFYSNASVTEMPDLISSAPMLIDNFEKVGETFCDYSLSSSAVNKLDGEDPERHQRVRHPRSAVALTENGHFIMLVVDGRTNYSNGMTCRELTRFMAKWFNPQYALNMDGGGSSSICVKGEGDPSTHVVNYPVNDVSDKTMRDHTHERPRDVHFVILKK
ncbi:MAG: phosphodiester glycosidase family protein [Bacteroidales bacterium]|nr:phosphodiester glycosidase family protein [Bacteroidales bacterium]